MRTTFAVFVIVLGFIILLPTPADGQQKLAQTGMKFLSVGTDPRGEALGEAFTAVEGSSSAMFFNPATMARLDRFASAMLGQTQWIADIKHNFGSVAFSPEDGKYGVIGISIQAVDYGDIIETRRDGDPNGLGYVELGTFKPTAMMVGLGYARALSDKFSLGGNVKFVTQNLGNAVVDLSGTTAGNSTNVWAFDFGILYRTGFKSLKFGMVVRNFSKEVKYVSEGFQLPLTFKIGLSMNLLDFMPGDQKDHSFLIAIDAEHPRDFAEQIKIGGEYVFMNLLSLRVGYVSPADEHGIVYGIGLQKTLGGVGLGIDYAYTPFGIFGNVHRWSLQFSL